MKTGLFGGTFNPIHLGHLKAIKEVKKRFPLDKIYIIPSAIPPHKDQTDVADANERYEMVKMAVKDDSEFKEFVEISDVELKRSGPSYTIDTVLHYKSILPEDSSFYLILGIDAFLEVNTWKLYMNLFDLIPFIIITRSGIENYKKNEGCRAVEEFLFTRISAKYRFNSKISGYVHEYKKTVFMLDIAPLDISSTMIRRDIRENKNIGSLVPVAVNSFIEKKRLYL
ncbi:MAG: nicotinate-nucleotide adenylyltransferase [Deltaproteobacteria bacterium]|nr:nicotinate-nucleotide adenylyltransferase [Deltaproteobacteria bacterium]